ncbi:efflux RND transporter periplasmic adaptor subunit [Massilia solisilvae]|uniref:Efflux RND transporter periplasmic adaptor subunit n=1 Tax=Massilia solisilvae TaxID=1811225 RepID=A0ABT2BFT2_9BURK|nr:efflux RND transporter periplasmic adaptor subunit [Massilia solisilvae]
MDTPDLSKLSIDRGTQPGARRRRKLPGWLWLLAAVVLLGALAALRIWTAPPAVETVNVTLAYPAQALTVLNATGYVAPQRKAAISSKATGRLEWLGVLEGSRVKEGQLIARLENRDVAAALGQARANVEVARGNLAQAKAEQVEAANALRRNAELRAKNFIAPATLDAVQGRYDKARANVEATQAAVVAAEANARAAQVALDQTLIRAPFDGVILTKNANVGDNITPFSSAAEAKGAVVTMADMDTLEVEADVSESNLAKIAPGQPAEIQLDAYPGLRLDGVVSRMVPTVDRSKATLLVKLRFVHLDPRVLPDMSARVAFLSRALRPSEKQPLPAVPPAAIVQRGGRAVVFVLVGGKAHERAVAAGRKLGDLMVVDGLAPGQKVVLNPPERLADGMPVEQAKK